MVAIKKQNLGAESALAAHELPPTEGAMAKKKNTPSRPRPSGPRTSGGCGHTRAYTCSKLAVLTAYYALLNSLFDHGTLLAVKFWGFVLVTPIVKYFFMFRTFSGREWAGRYGCSVLVDWGRAWACHQMTACDQFTHGYGLFVIGLITLSVVLEYSTFRVVSLLSRGEGKDSYVIKTTPGGLGDQLLGVIVGALFSLFGLFFLDFDATPDVWTFPLMFSTMMLGDLIFGVLHRWSHINAALWKRHSIHHMYKAEDLNSFANFCTDMLDGVMMDSVMVPVLLGASLATQPPWVVSDVIIAASLTHNKYNTEIMHFIFHFEFDILDIIFKSEDARIGSFHNAHHKFSARNFSVFGTVSDEWVTRVSQYLGGAASKLHVIDYLFQ